MSQLQELNTLVQELNESNSVLDKKIVLRKHPQCKDLLRWVYNPYIQFYVTSANLEKRQDLVDDESYQDIEILLHMLSKRHITGHAAISACNAYVRDNVEYKDLIYMIIDKNLKTRTDAKLINAVYPGLIPTFDVALANKYEDQEKKIDFTKDKWFASRKLDGVRCLSVPMDNINRKMMSRQGKEFFTLGKIEQDLSRLADWSDYVFDGEVCIIDEDGNENFQSVVKEIRRKDHIIQNPRFKIFDVIEKDHFDRGESPKGFDFAHRLDLLEKVKDDIEYSGLTTLDVVEQIPIQSKEHLTEMADAATDKGWEGLIIRKDAPYKGKRSNDLLKVKKMHDAEYKVISIENGPFRVISKETGLEVEEQMLSRVNIEHKGNIVGVGSGFSLDQRRYYYENPDAIIGKTITVKYFEESHDQNGRPSLRFPIVKHIYENGRDV